MKALLIYSILILLPLTALSEEDSLFIKKENQLSLLLENLRKAENDGQKNEANVAFKTLLQETLTIEGAFSYPFASLKSVGFIDSPDGLVRIVNWNVEQDDNSHVYSCFVMRKDERKKTVQITELIDNSFMMAAQPEDVLDSDQWYGALYYKIIPIDKGSKTLYTLLGWDGNTSASNVKLIDVLYFNGNQPKLGSPIFKMKNETLKRVFFEHSEKATMSLRFEEQYNRIIFDHLSPESPGLEGFYSFYVPDLSLDAFMLVGSKWVLKEDVIGINSPEGNDKIGVYAINERNGNIEKKDIKNKWLSPDDGKGAEHRALTPEDELKLEEEKKTSNPKNKVVKDKRDPSQMNSTLGTNKKKKKRKS